MLGVDDAAPGLSLVDRGIHRYDPAARAFVALGVAFAATPWVLLRLSTGPVLAIDEDGAIALFE